MTDEKRSELEEKDLEDVVGGVEKKDTNEARKKTM